MQQMMAELEDPSVIVERKESGGTLVKELRETAFAMKRTLQEEENKEANFAEEVMSDSNPQVLAQVSLENKRKGESIISLTETSS